MSLTYERAPKEVADLVADAMTRYHRVLAACEVTVDVLLVDDVDDEGESGPALKHGGYLAAATIKATPLKQRALGQADALMMIDAFGWGGMGDDERLALIDHKLEHLQVRADKGVVSIDPQARKLVGSPRVDDAGRPVLKLRLHDWQLGGFTSIARRHGLRALEVQAVRRCKTETGQFFWDWDIAGAVSSLVDAAAKAGAESVTLSSQGRSVELVAKAGERLREPAAPAE